MSDWSVAFLDVGQGNCVVAVDESEHVALVVDCPPGRARFAEERLRQTEASLHTVLVSHSHLDHVGGVLELIDLIGPNRIQQVNYNHDVAMSADPLEAAKLRATLRRFEELEEEGLELDDARAPRAGDVGALKWTALAPSKGKLSGALARGDPNSASAIILLMVDQMRFMLPGDADERLWVPLLDGGVDLRADVLSIPHHGGSVSESGHRVLLARILDAVGASYHVVSVGRSNPYGHPRADTLVELGVRQARVLCTQINAVCQGTVDITLVHEQARRSLPRTVAGPSDGSPCAGTCIFRGGGGRVALMPTQHQHDLVIDELDDPQCRLSSTA